MPVDEWQTEMLAVAGASTRLITSRDSKLSKEAAIKAVLFGALSVIRADGMDEKKILEEVLKVMPKSVAKIRLEIV